MGPPAATTRGFGVSDFSQVGHMIADVLEGLKKGDTSVQAKIRQDVLALCQKFPIYV